MLDLSANIDLFCDVHSGLRNYHLRGNNDEENPGEKPVKKRFAFSGPEELIEEAKMQRGEGEEDPAD